MDSNTTASGGVPLLQLDPATSSALLWALVVGVVVIVVLYMAVVISLFRGPKEGLEEPAGCFPGGDGGGGRAPQQQPPAAEAVAIEVAAGEDDAVPKVIICRTDDDGGGRQEPTCGVCLAELAGGGALRALSPCRHYFHSACARDWVRLHATCPICQAPVAGAGATVFVL